MKGMVFNIQRYSLQDGPGIRSTVFLKGCPLSCMWCSNPESQAAHPQLAHNDALCNGCGRCVSACPLQAIALNGKTIAVDREHCDNCAKCVYACNEAALKIFGEEMDVDAVVAEVIRDDKFYRRSDGGVTISGGEPLYQAEFARLIFEGCRNKGIHTCLDTTGYARPEVFERVIEFSDLLYFDLKSMNSRTHKKVAGVPNGPILKNAQLAASNRVKMVVRIPLIPDVNDSIENLNETADFVAGLDGNSVQEVNILPYHRFGAGKYRMLDRAYPLEKVPSTDLDAERVQEAKRIMDSRGLNCRIEV